MLLLNSQKLSKWHKVIQIVAAVWCSGLSWPYDTGIPYEHDLSQLLHFFSSSLFTAWEKWQQMAQDARGPVICTEELMKSPGFSAGIVAILEINQWREDLFLSPSLCNSVFQLDKQIFKK